MKQNLFKNTCSQVISRKEVLKGIQKKVKPSREIKDVPRAIIIRLDKIYGQTPIMN